MAIDQPMEAEIGTPAKQVGRGAVHVLAPLATNREKALSKAHLPALAVIALSGAAVIDEAPCVRGQAEADPPEARAENIAGACEAAEAVDVVEEIEAADGCVASNGAKSVDVCAPEAAAEAAREAPPPDEEPGGACGGEPEINTYSPLFPQLRYTQCVDPFGEGLLYYQKYWYLSDVDISVRGEMISGTPMGLHDNTLRLINKEYSYYIPLRQVDYIRTADGLESSFRKECLFDSEGAGCGVHEGRCC